jgi:hypothetical protein
MPRAQFSKEAKEEAVSYAAELMIRLRSSYQVQKNLVAKYQISTRTARRLMTAVRERWAEERKNTDDVELHETRRDRERETLNTTIALALGRTQVVKNDDGTVVLDKQGRPVVRANPDLQKVLHAVRVMMDLDGLSKPIKAKITVDGEITAMPNLKDLGPQAAQALEGFLKTIAPEQDVAKLAGDWFKFSGEDKR